uniref:C2H2-type domain-containing protein n=1 Tax=Trichuris muris TaxID=70415 RepID=A0A5S6R4L8_TRIMR
MGRKKKKFVKPWCWYCNREFDDDKVLVQHQKAKHFKCHLCHKKLYTGPGLAIHCMQVHKETIERIPNSISNRGSTEIEIYGMEGIPEADLKAHEAAVLGKDDEPLEKMARVEDQSSSQVNKSPVVPLIPGISAVNNLPYPYQLPGSAVSGIPPAMQSAVPSAVPGATGVPPIAGQQSSTALQSGMPSPVLSATVPGMSPGSVPPVMPTYPTSNYPVSPGTTVSQPSNTTPAAFPAYQSAAAKGQTRSTPSPVAPRPIIVGSGGTMIMHPDEDMSLEEIRLSFPKYAVKGQGIGGRATAASMAAPPQSGRPYNDAVTDTASPTLPVPGMSPRFLPPGAPFNMGHPPPLLPPYQSRNVY